MKHLCYLGILKEKFSSYSSPTTLISRKVTQGKRVVTDFRHLNVRIAKNNLAYPLVRNTFSVLINSQVQGSFSIRFKGCISLTKAFGRFKKILQYITILWKHIIHISENAYGIEYLTFNRQSYINAILECLQNRKNCEAIMDGLLLFTPSKRAHMAKLEDLLKALLKNTLKISPKKCLLFKTELQYMGTLHS